MHECTTDFITLQLINHVTLLSIFPIFTHILTSRYGNPTTRVVEEKIRELEGAEDCLVSASGMNSATTMLLALVPAGGHIITTTDCYRRTRQFIQTVLPKMGVTATVLDPADMGALEQALEEHDVSVYFSESPTNPYLRYGPFSSDFQQAFGTCTWSFVSLEGTCMCKLLLSLHSKAHSEFGQDALRCELLLQPHIL